MSRKNISLEELNALGIIKCSIDEQETSFVCERGNKFLSGFTSDNTMLTKLKHLMENSNGNWVIDKVELNDKKELMGVHFYALKSLVSLRKGKANRQPPKKEQLK